MKLRSVVAGLSDIRSTARCLGLSGSRLVAWPALAVSIVLLSGCASSDEQAQSYYEKGMALIAKKDDLGARLELLKAVKYKSDKVEVWRALAGIDERTKANSLFLDLRRIVELDPNDLDARLRMVRIMVAGGSADAALKVLDAATEGDKPNAALHALRAIVLLRTRDAQGAVREAQRAIQIDPANVDALGLLASRRIAEGDADGALKLLAAGGPAAADDSRIVLLKAQAFERKGDVKQVEDQLRKLMALNPDNPAYQDAWIRFLISQKRMDEAEKAQRARVAANPGDSKLGLQLVRLAGAARGADAARNELEARIKAGGDGFEYQMALAELNVAENKFDAAVNGLQALAASAVTPEKKAAAQVRLAELYIGKANLPAAEPLIADVLAKDRRNAGALRLRAGIRADRGQFDEAIADLREALNDQAKSVDLLLTLAAVYERSGKNELADRQYGDALKASGSSPEVVLRYAAFLQRRNDPARVEDVLSEAASRYPDNLQIQSSLAQARLSRQNWSGAMTVAETVGKAARSSSQPSNSLILADEIKADALAGQNKVEESIAALEDAHRLSPDSVQPFVALLSGYSRNGKFDKANALLKEASQKYPDNAQVLVIAGQAELAQNKEREAIGHFKEAIAKQPKQPVGYGALSDYYLRQKKYDAADEVMVAALKQMPDNLNIRLSRAGLMVQKQDYEGAIAQYDSILKDQPNQLVAMNNLASLLLDYRTDKASLDRALALAQQLRGAALPSIQDTVGWAQYRGGDYAKAVATLEDVVVKLPNLSAAHYHLGMSYKAAGQADKAAAQFKTALDLEPDGTELKERIRTASK